MLHVKNLFFRLHIMSGVRNHQDCPANEEVLRKNLANAIPLLEEANVIGLIEPINSYSVPDYFLNSFDLGKCLMTVGLYKQDIKINHTDY